MSVDDRILQQLIKNSADNAAQVKLLTKLVKDQSALLSKPDASKLSGNTRQRERRNRQKNTIDGFRQGTRNAMDKFPDPRNPQSLTSITPSATTLAGLAAFGALFGNSAFKGLDPMVKKLQENFSGMTNGLDRINKFFDEMRRGGFLKFLMGGTSSKQPVNVSKGAMDAASKLPIIGTAFKQTQGTAANRVGVKRDAIDKNQGGIIIQNVEDEVGRRVVQQLRDEAGLGRTASKYKPDGKTVGKTRRTLRGLTGRRTMTPLADRIKKARDIAAEGYKSIKDTARGGIDFDDYKKMESTIAGRVELKARASAREAALKAINWVEGKRIAPSSKDKKLAEEGLELLKKAGMVSKDATLGLPSGTGKSAIAAEIFDKSGKKPGRATIKITGPKKGIHINTSTKNPVHQGIDVLEKMEEFRGKDPVYKSTILKEGQDSHKIHEAMKKVVKSEYAKKGYRRIAEKSTTEVVDTGARKGLLTIAGQAAKGLFKGAARLIGTPLTIAESAYHGYGARKSITQREEMLQSRADVDNLDEQEYMRHRAEATRLLKAGKITNEFYANYMRSLDAKRTRRRLGARLGMDNYASASWNLLGGLTGTISEAGKPLNDNERVDLEEANRVMRDSYVSRSELMKAAGHMDPKSATWYHPDGTPGTLPSTKIYNNFFTNPSEDPSKIFEGNMKE